MTNLKELSEVQRMWADGYTQKECLYIIRNDYSENDEEILSMINHAFLTLDIEFKRMFIRIKYEE